MGYILTLNADQGDTKIAISHPSHGSEWKWAGPAPIIPRLPITGQ